ncbi:LPXTG cell wall anchor domain-containing protein [Blastococcus capsensis]|uniref:LPXTG cell wall anchor domain-containing protein n=1 Tax=Blastococcus capsensis TaxID=1564163 RepID=UPI00254035FA|nr:LPXTG cell wall anchor domain-containing protein [Blastococcus capsensis]MDK3258000.1 LPXTG cell wall anchor domain-containing protein [Blastococcus capsensis]
MTSLARPGDGSGSGCGSGKSPRYDLTGGSLAYTGTEVGAKLGLAGLLTAAGATALVFGRRRSASTD